ncbi:hypothetical protein PENSPDRAFT_353119 [Peniophora sp. CONT]|nr:hypothetical protein PENSPDRAFT_353119 [Peniophora sp. CONT]
MTSSSNTGLGETRFTNPEDRWTFLTDGEEDLEEIHSPHSATKPTGRVGCLNDSRAMRILPLDIVYELLPFLETRDLLMFMRTCKALRERGARHILSRRIPIRRVESFACFMEASPHRYQYLLHVIYSPHRAEPTSIKRLVSVLSQASALVSLELLCRLDKLEDVLKKKLFDAISRISSLRCLRISTHGAGHLTDNALLLRLSPRLTSLRLSFAAPTDPFPTLPSALLDNLETLYLEQACFMPLETPLLRLKSLTAQDSFLRTRTLVTSFPNLRHLRLFKTGRGAHLPSKQTETDAIRSINVNEQMDQCWSSLDTLSGNLISLHDLALAAPVHALHIETEIVVGVHDQLLCTVLQDTRPSRLPATLDHRSAESTSPSLNGVRALLQTATNLNHLSLRVVWRSCELGEGDIQAAKDFVVRCALRYDHPLTARDYTVQYHQNHLIPAPESREQRRVECLRDRPAAGTTDAYPSARHGTLSGFELGSYAYAVLGGETNRRRLHHARVGAEYW